MNKADTNFIELEIQLIHQSVDNYFKKQDMVNPEFSLSYNKNDFFLWLVEKHFHIQSYTIHRNKVVETENLFKDLATRILQIKSNLLSWKINKY